ncbi:hypothetical protein HUG10_07430 [Halorarum halophilum]|uniref:Uncharacterized protein n=1 Tax=Halorarum halophilum TaxID=2743090 RepID=A0A7D5GEI7_9EURY|nr:hypothetical protein [Halobaculum halophilum]QLG27388.1 hypothetical protein HUG10_07430 [Halobaculum halophilum]
MDVVEDFERARAYAVRHPDHGRNRAGANLNMDPGRIRGWINETSKPDLVRGLEYARERSWLNIHRGGQEQSALAVLVAGLYACGGIAVNWVPAWTPETDRAHELITDALDELAGGYTSRHEDSEKPTEFLPEDSPSVFGRVLVAYGAPQGDKNAESVTGLPEWLLDAPITTRLPAVELFILERGIYYDSKDTITLQCRNRRPAYRADLAALIRSVTDGSVEAKANVVISAKAARELGFGRGDALRT